MNVKEKFLELTSRTYPHGTEKELFHLLGDGLTEDEFGNLFIKIGESDVMFTSHLDTATSALTKVNHVFDKNIIKTDGKSILGADDKAGVTIMLYMIEKEVPGLYYFFLGEEVGCIGSKKVANKLQTEKIEGINKVISFDRRGTTSVITYQSSQRCASDKFGEALALELNKADETFSYKTDDTGVLTDSIQFIKIYSECTNISVGYQSEHTFSETQDIEHLEKLALACIKVNWNDLPVERDPSKTEYKSYGGYGSYGGRYWGDDDYYNTGSYYKGNNLNSWSRNGYVSKPKTENVWFNDAEFNFVSKVEVETVTKKYVSVDLHVDRISKEKVMIERLLKSLEVDFVSTSWDGMKLVVNYDGNDHSSDADRNDLIEYIPELDYRLLEDELDSDNSNLDYGYLDSIYE
jgi:hypothetical protein